MSRHTLNTMTSTQQPVLVALGWDRPLQSYFGTVFDASAEADEDDVLYSEMDDPMYRPLKTIVEGIERLGITLPIGMINAVMQDKIVNAGNVLKDWTAT